MDSDKNWHIEIPVDRVPDVPMWSENYCWDAYDPVRRIFLWLHVGRWPHDPAMWHEFFVVCIDGKVTYSRRNIGRLHDPRLVGANCMRLECVQPLQRWHFLYHGPALRCTAQELMVSPPPDSVTSLMDFDMVWEAACPLIDFGHSVEPDAESAGSHNEQGGTLRGHISFDGERHEFDGRSFRDHSRGPRNIQDTFSRHSWIHGTFPSGRTISSLIIEKPDGALGVRDMFVTDAKGVTEKYDFDPPLLWDTWDNMERPYTLAGVHGNGSRITVQAEPQFFVPFTSAHPSDLFVGQSNKFVGHRIIEMPTRLVWDGEETYGLTEISFTKAKSQQYPG